MKSRRRIRHPVKLHMDNLPLSGLHGNGPRQRIEGTTLTRSLRLWASTMINRRGAPGNGNVKHNAAASM
jgi:hypothetical protein